VVGGHGQVGRARGVVAPQRAEKQSYVAVSVSLRPESLAFGCGSGRRRRPRSPSRARAPRPEDRDSELLRSRQGPMTIEATSSSPKFRATTNVRGISERALEWKEMKSSTPFPRLPTPPFGVCSCRHLSADNRGCLPFPCEGPDRTRGTRSRYRAWEEEAARLRPTTPAPSSRDEMRHEALVAGIFTSTRDDQFSAPSWFAASRRRATVVLS
jgi:hypothetical protein